MLTFVIEDEPLKLSKIQAFLQERYPTFKCEFYGSFQSGLRAIEACPCDLLLLDMHLPTFDRAPRAREGRWRPIGGYEIMRKIRLREIKMSIIVVTQLESFGEGKEKVSFEEITDRCTAEFPSMFKGSVYFRQGSTAWQAELAKKIDEIVEGSTNGQNTAS